MPPRKSTSRQAQPQPLAASTATTTATPAAPITPHSSSTLSSSTRRAPLSIAKSAGLAHNHHQPVASSSRVTLDSLPTVDIPESITPGYVRKGGDVRGLDEEERGRLIHELVGFYPRILLDYITEDSRKCALEIAAHVEVYVQKLALGKGEEYSREIDVGIYAFETLLSNLVDKAFDKFTAWALRNTFDIPDDIEVVLPWCQGIDFERGEYVASLPGGEEAVLKTLEETRRRVEQMRYLSQQLEYAEKALDKRLAIAKQRKAEVGFVQEVLKAANLTPLAPSLAQSKSSLTSLHAVISEMPDPGLEYSATTPSNAHPNSNQKAWEMGRQAYLAWAVGKAIANNQRSGLGGSAEPPQQQQQQQHGVPGKEEMDGVERDLGMVGSQADLERLSRGL